MPHVLPAEVDIMIEDLGDRVSGRVEPARGRRWDEGGSLRHRRIDQADAVRDFERKLVRHRHGGPHGEVGDLERVDLEGVLPAEFRRIDRFRARRHLPALVDAVNELGMEQVGVHGVGIHTIVKDPPDLGAVGHHADRRRFQRPHDKIRGGRRQAIGDQDMDGRVLDAEPQHPAHPAENGVVHSPHLVVHRLHLERQGDRRLKLPMLVDGIERLRRLEKLHILLHGAGRKRRVVGRIVGGLRNDDRVLRNLEHPAFALDLGGSGIFVPLGENRFEVFKGDVGSGTPRGCRDPDLHHGPGIGAVAGQRVGRSAGVHLVAVPRVVVEGSGARRDRRRRVVVEDEGLARVGAEIDHHIRPLGRADVEGVLVDDPVAEVPLVEVPADRLLRHADRLRHEAPLGTDHPPLRSRCFGIGHPALERGVLVVRKHAHRDHLDLGAEGRIQNRTIAKHGGLTALGSGGRGGLVRRHV